MRITPVDAVSASEAIAHIHAGNVKAFRNDVDAAFMRVGGAERFMFALAAAAADAVKHING